MASSDLPPLDPILKQKYPAKAHCRNVAKYLANQQLSADGFFYLESQYTKMVEDDDQAMHFRQRRYFFYLTGCKLPDSFMTYNIEKDFLTLYIPPIDPDSVIWAGLPESPEEAMRNYDVDQVLLTSDLASSFTSLSMPSTEKSRTAYIMLEHIKEPVLQQEHNIEIKNEVLRVAIDECRVVKDSYEVAMIRRANQISTIAHLEAQKAARTATNEQELYGAFIGTCISNGAHEQAYHSICASGTSCSTLHYIRNDQPLQSRLNILLDAGAEYNCYCADITRTFPLSGQFTPESQTIYDIVKEMQNSAFEIIRAGIHWEEVHILTHKIAIKGLVKAGILVGDEQELFDKNLSVAFYPHGLGHYLGMDTHDTGGHANYDDANPMLKYLRVRGAVPAGAVITVEPGVYFCKFIIDPVLADPNLAKYIDENVLERYWDVGGVRIEDDVLVTETGYENLTDTPKL